MLTRGIPEIGKMPTNAKLRRRSLPSRGTVRRVGAAKWMTTLRYFLKTS